MSYTGLTLEDRAVGAYLGLAVGDALGATTEFLTPREIREQLGTHRKMSGGGWLKLKPGQVTDDTEMSLALGRAILDNKGVYAEAVAGAFSDWMRTKPVDIGNTVRRGIMHFRSTGDACVPENEFDAGNGACMRCLPIALSHWNAPREVMNQASRIQSHVTHHNEVADTGTESVLYMLVCALKGEPKSVMQEISHDLVRRHKVFRHDRKPIENPDGWIVETLRAVFQAFFGHDSFASILIDVVNRGGDADTTGAVAGMLAGACYGRHAIPRQWLKTLNAEVRMLCEEQALELLRFAESQVEWVQP